MPSKALLGVFVTLVWTLLFLFAGRGDISPAGFSPCKRRTLFASRLFADALLNSRPDPGTDSGYIHINGFGFYARRNCTGLI